MFTEEVIVDTDKETLKKQYAELKQKYDELNDFSNSQLAKVLKENEELKAEISALLSCSNCSDNKGGYICEKEYNNKCLAQKIEYIKELEKENTELKIQNEKMENCWNCKFFKEKKYQACIDYKKNNTKCCAFYKWEFAE